MDGRLMRQLHVQASLMLVRAEGFILKGNLILVGIIKRLFTPAT